MNLYGYCGNNPVNYSDPLGLCEDGKPWMGYIHTGLDVIGLIPGIGEIADGANALLYLYEGDYFNAAISGVSALGGDGAKLLRGGSNLVGGAGFIIKHGDDAADAGKHVDDYVNLASDKRTQHILFGDASGGGHMWPGNPGKSVFPQGWSTDKIMHEVSDIVTDPSLTWDTGRVVGGIQRYEVIGIRDGVRIKIITDGTNIITAFPF